MARLRAQAVERDPSTGTGMHIDNIEEEEEIGSLLSFYVQAAELIC